MLNPLENLANTQGWYYAENKAKESEPPHYKIGIMEKPSWWKRFWYCITDDESTSMTNIRSAFENFLDEMEKQKDLSMENKKYIEKITKNIETLNSKIIDKINESFFTCRCSRYDVLGDLDSKKPSLLAINEQIKKLLSQEKAESEEIPSDDEDVDAEDTPATDTKEIPADPDEEEDCDTSKILDESLRSNLPDHIYSEYEREHKNKSSDDKATFLLRKYQEIRDGFRKRAHQRVSSDSLKILKGFQQALSNFSLTKEELQKIKTTIEAYEAMVAMSEEGETSDTCPPAEDIPLTPRSSSSSSSRPVGTRRRPVSYTAEKKLSGTPNRGNDCFLNAILQNLFAMYGDMLDKDESITDDVSDQIRTLETRAIEIRAMLRKIRDKVNEGQAVSKAEIGALRKKLLSDKKDKLNIVETSSSQEDAAELFTKLLDLCLYKNKNYDPLNARIYVERHVEYTETRQPRESENPPKASKIDLVIPEGNKKTYLEEPDTMLRISVPNNDDGSLRSSLHAWQETGKEYHYGSPRAKKPRDRHEWYKDARGNVVKLIKAKERHTFKSLPSRLTIQLKRFEGSSKNRHQFAVDPEITIKDSEGNTAKYRLVSFVNHDGGGSGSGHYRSARFKDGVWHQCNDNTIRAIGNTGVDESTNHRLVIEDANLKRDLERGYIYFYEKIS